MGDFFATKKLLGFSVFFALPISFFAWFVSRRAALLVSAISAAIIMGISLDSPLHEIDSRVAYWNTLVWLGFFLLITFIITDLKGLHLREKELSRIDNLTQVASRLAFYEFANNEINRARRFSLPRRLPISISIAFSKSTTAWGMQQGDKVLITIGKAMQNSIRQTDLVARVGGDEFALILPNTHKDAAHKLLTKLLQVLARNMQQNEWPVTFSIGAVTFLTPPQSVHEMIKRADEIMYSVKQSGKNRLRQEEWAA